MKIILRRKGFDSSLGGYPSPILPDGKMVSLPIPLNDFVKYSDLKVGNGLSYYDLMKQLRTKIKIGKQWQALDKETKCYLDPDISRTIIAESRAGNPVLAR